MRPLFGVLGAAVHLKPLQRGLLGFQQAAQICAEDLVLGRMDYGGNSQRGWIRVDLPGTGCEWVSDWDLLGGVEALPQSQLRRVDLALTTWKGEVTHERVVEAHASGAFTLSRPPTMQQIISSDPFAGRTCYIGRREKSDKFMRCYEKGWELLKDMPTSGMLRREDIRLVNGFPPADIYRCEVEFKAVTTELSWEMVPRSDEFFAGAYPFCAQVLPGIEPDVLQRRPTRTAEAKLALALENCRVQFGPTLFTALAAYHGDIGAVWDKVIGAMHNEKLLEAGVLLADHS